MISGDSSDDISKDCLVNYVKPYHAASATGAGGSTDFSKWNLTLSSNYTEIKEGSNRITAKLSCPLISTRWYSVNPIGARTNHTNTNIYLPTLAPSVLSPTNESAASILLPPEQQQPSAPPTSSGITSESSGQKNKTMSVTIDVTSNPISRGSRQNISITVSDTASNEKIAGASITGKLLNPGGNYLRDFNGNTDFNGQFVYSWIIGKKGDRGELTIEAQAAASGYKPKSVTCISNI